MFLFDTDILSNVLKRAPSTALVARLAILSPDQQFTTAITVGEMVYGAHRSPRRDHLLRQLEERLWPNVRILTFDRASAEIYGRLRASLEAKGTPISEPDLRIGAVALAHDLTVVTCNTRHFQKVPGLRVENWL